MSERRRNVGVGVLGGIIYAIGGINGVPKCLKSVEAYTTSTGVWTTVADMHFPRYDFGDLFLKKILIILY